ncbi:MAG: rane fusion protein YbhG [Bacillota bacterium]|nr:rane fusion protein YbhG [Bacillota bacterium]MDK2925281.1 rane fusion protein YbhG [Bacillota bacterium]
MKAWPKISRLLLVLFVAAQAFLLVGCRSGTRADRLTANGTIEATEIRVVAEVGGVLKELAVKEGDRVKAGQLIGRVDAAPYQLAVGQAEAQVAEARASYEEALSGSRGQEIEAARQEVESLTHQVAAAEEALSLAEDTLRRTEQLFKEGVAPEQELVLRQNQANVARDQLESMKAQLAAARARLELLRSGNPKETLERLQARVRQSEENLASAKLNLKKTNLVAPAAGTVVSCNFTPGELVFPGSEVATLIDEQDLWLNVYVPENKLGRVRIGQPVEIRVDAYPGKVFSGRVVYISPQAEFTPRNVQTQEDRVNLVFRVKIKVTGGQEDLHPGLPADVTFK